MAEMEEVTSWLESRRLISAQLASLDMSIKELSVRIDKYNDAAREKTNSMSLETREAINEMKIRISMIEVQAKIWSSVIGVLAGGVGSVLVLVLANGVHLKLMGALHLPVFNVPM